MAVSPGYFGVMGFTLPWILTPAVGDVRNGTAYGAMDNELIGTLDTGGGGIIPSADDVRDGVAVAATTGNLVLPAEVDVRLGIDYGTAGTEFEGTLEVEGGGGGGPTIASSTVPVAGGTTRIVRGDDYLATDGRALSWDVLTELNLSAGDVTFLLYHSLQETTTDLSIDCTVAVIADGYTVTADVTGEQTAGDGAQVLPIPLGLKRYEVQVELASGHIVTLVEGVCDITH